jgi:hypothetical protein
MLSAFLRSPYTAAMMSKAMIAPANTRGGAITDAKLGAEVSLSEMNSISSKIARDSDFATNALEMAPDLEISMAFVAKSESRAILEEMLFISDRDTSAPSFASVIAPPRVFAGAIMALLIIAAV